MFVECDAIGGVGGIFLFSSQMMCPLQADPSSLAGNSLLLIDLLCTCGIPSTGSLSARTKSHFL